MESFLSSDIIQIHFGEPLNVVRLDRIRLRSSLEPRNLQEWVAHIRNSECSIVVKRYRLGCDAARTVRSGAPHLASCYSLQLTDSDTVNAEDEDVAVEERLPLSVVEAVVAPEYIPFKWLQCCCVGVDEGADDDADKKNLSLSIITYMSYDNLRAFTHARENTSSWGNNKCREPYLTYTYLCKVFSRDCDFNNAANKLQLRRNTPSEIEQLLGFVCDYHNKRPATGELIAPDELLLDELRLTLHNYQKRAVCWMVSRERASASVEADDNGIFVKTKQFPNPKFVSAVSPAGDVVSYSFYDGSVVLNTLADEPERPVITDTVCGGILADEMGLGKTLEILACIMNDPILVQRKINKTGTVAATVSESATPSLELNKRVSSNMVNITDASLKTNLRDACVAVGQNVVRRGRKSQKLCDEGRQSLPSQPHLDAQVNVKEDTACNVSTETLTSSYTPCPKAGRNMKRRGENESLPERSHRVTRSSTRAELVKTPAIIKDVENSSDTTNDAVAVSGRKRSSGKRSTKKIRSLEVEKILGGTGVMHAAERCSQTREVLNSIKSVKGSERSRALRKLETDLLEPYACAKFVTKRREVPVERLHVECICGSDSADGIVQCDSCKVWQHRSCTGFYLDQLSEGASSVYRCPQCYQDSENLETHATLIVVPRALLQQWFDEISKCVKPSAVSVFIYNGTTVLKQGNGQRTRGLTWNKSIIDNHKHDNVTSNISTGDIKESNSSGSRIIYTHPLVIAKHDIVITSYEILRDELAFVDLPEMRSKLRHPKRYNHACSPLTGIRFRRLVFDEAQLVEKSTRRQCAMAMRISAQYVWALTGTPIVESFEDLYGLFKLLREASLEQPLQFKMSLMVPYALCGNSQPLQTSLAHVMYRQSQQSVREELNLPLIIRHVHTIELDPIERAYYAVRQTTVKNTVRGHAAGLNVNRTLSDLDANVHQQLLSNVNGLRMICLHPLLAGVQRGSRMVIPGIGGASSGGGATFKEYEGRSRRKRADDKTKKSFGLRDSLLKLIMHAKNEVVDEQRKVLFNLNGLASISWLEGNYADAADYYRQAMYIWRELEPIGIEADRLQRIHTLANLHELLQLHAGESNIGRTLSDDTLQTQAEQLKAEHIKKLTSALALADSKIEAVRTLGRIRPLIDHADEAIVWVADLLNRDVLNLGGKTALDSLISGLTGCMMDQGFTRKFLSSADAFAFFVSEWKALVAAHEAALVMVNKLQKAELTSEFAQRVYMCHLAPRSMFGRIAKEQQQTERCDLCKCTVAVTRYETMLFRNCPNIRTAKNREGARGAHTKTSAAAADWIATDDVESELLGDVHKMVRDTMIARNPQAFETAVTWLYTRRKNFYSHTSSSAAPLVVGGEDGFGSRYEHLQAPQLVPKIFSHLGKEFWLMRVVLQTVQYRTSAFDEAGRQALLRIQLKPDEAQSAAASEEQPRTGSSKRKPMNREYRELHPLKKNEEDARLYIARNSIPTYRLRYTTDLTAARAEEKRKLSKYRFTVSLRQRMKKVQPTSSIAAETTASGNAGMQVDENDDVDDDPLARDILKDEKCPLCWELLMQLPAYSFLPCAHFICDEDLSQLVRVNQGWLECPQCRERCQPDSIVHVDNRCRAVVAPAAPPALQQSILVADSIPSSSAVSAADMMMPSTSAAARAAAAATTVVSDEGFNISAEADVQGDLSSKIAAVVKCLRLIKRLDPEAGCLVFSGFPLAMKMLKTACQENAINAASVQTSSEVARVLDRLNNRQIDALILSYQACSRGLNITEANHILLLEPVLNKADELQAIGRAYRIGQTRNVHVHYFITKNTIEERMHGALRDVETFSVPQSSISNLTVGMINAMVGFSADSPAVAGNASEVDGSADTTSVAQNVEDNSASGDEGEASSSHRFFGRGYRLGHQ